MNKQREAVIQNLKDAGCKKDLIEQFLVYYDKQEGEQQIALLEKHRNHLLDKVHIEEKKIFCIDYLIYQIEKYERSKNV